MMTAKKRTNSDDDRHKQKHMTVRLPKHLQDLVRGIAATEDRTMTAVLIRSLRLYCEHNNYQWPESGGNDP